MDPITLGMLGVGAAQTIGGLFKKAKAKRPEYEIPSEVYQTLAMARMQAEDPYAAGYTQAAEQLGTTTSNAIGQAAQSGSVAEMLPAIVAQQSLGMQQLQAQNIQQQAADQKMLMAALGEMAKSKDTEFQMNELAPYSDMYNESREMIGAGLQNLLSGATLATIDNEGNGILKNLTKGRGKTNTVTPNANNDLMNFLKIALLGGKNPY